MHKKYWTKGNIVSGYSNRQRKGHDRSNMPGAPETKYPKRGHKGKGIGKLHAPGGGYA